MLRTLLDILSLGTRAGNSSLFRPSCKICGRPAKYGVSSTENYCSVKCAKLDRYKINVTTKSWSTTKNKYSYYDFEKAEQAIKVTSLLLEQIKNYNCIITDIFEKGLWSIDNFVIDAEFSKPKPKITVLNPPDKTTKIYSPKFSIIDYLILKRKERKITLTKELFESDMKKWQFKKDEIEKQYNKEMSIWVEEKRKFEEKKDKQNKLVSDIKCSYEGDNIEGIRLYFKFLIKVNNYSKEFPKICNIRFVPNNRTLIVDYVLPSIDVIPKQKSLRYIKSTDALKETFHSNKYIKDFYKILLYRILLRCLCIIYFLDYKKKIFNVIINGFLCYSEEVKNIQEMLCIISLSCDKEKFLTIKKNLHNPEICMSSMNQFIKAKSFNNFDWIMPISTN